MQPGGNQHTAPSLGATVRDSISHVEGVLIAVTHWHDRSDEAAIQRVGLNGDGDIFALHWLPIARLFEVKP